MDARLREHDGSGETDATFDLRHALSYNKKNGVVGVCLHYRLQQYSQKQEARTCRC